MSAAMHLRDVKNKVERKARARQARRREAEYIQARIIACRIKAANRAMDEVWTAHPRPGGTSWLQLLPGGFWR